MGMKGKIIRATKWTKDVPAENDSRVILSDIGHGMYASHIQICSNKDTKKCEEVPLENADLIYGHYDTYNLKDAIEEFDGRRLKEFKSHPKYYKPFTEVVILDKE